jgi:hypothetical protein
MVVKKNVICFVLFVVAFLIFPGSLWAQDEDGFLDIKGVCLKAGKPLEGAKIVVLKDGKKDTELTTRKNGRYYFELEFNHEYVINFSAPGHYDMKLLVSSKLPSSVKLPFFPLYQFDVPFYELTDVAVNKRSFDRPITRVFYDEKIKRFKDDETFADVNAQEKPTAVIAPVKKKVETTVEQEVKPVAMTTPAQPKKEEPKVTKPSEPVVTQQPVKSPPPTTAAKKSIESDAISFQKKKELREQQIRENKKVKAEVENNILKVVAENERRQNEARFRQQALETMDTELIKIIEIDKALRNALMEQQRINELNRLQAEANRHIKNEQEASLLKSIAYAQKEQDQKSGKGKSRSLVLPEITEEVSTDVYKETVITTIKTAENKNQYKKITYHWGGVYYFKDNESISAQKYYREVNIYGPHLK